MKTWLCSPLASFLGPMQGVARLHAYLRKQGHQVSLKDLNQDAYFALLSRPNLERILDNMKYILEPVQRNKFLREDIGAILLHSSNNSLRQLLSGSVLAHSVASPLSHTFVKRPALRLIGSKLTDANVLYALLAEKDFVLNQIEKSRQALDRQWFALPPETFIEHFRALLCGKAIIDAAHFPAQLDFGFGLHGTAYNPAVGDIVQATTDEKHNFLIPYYRDNVLPELREERPDVVGISVTHTGDFVPAFTLASMIKKEDPAIHITLGGATLTEIAYRLASASRLWDYFDSLVLGPGERVFSSLIEELEKGADLSTVPNLMYKLDGAVRKSERPDEFDINEACTPEYASPRPKSGLPLEASSGCYWGKCIFCYYPKIGSAAQSSQYPATRVRDIELVLNDMRVLKEKYDPIYIGFTDSSFSPHRLEQLAEYNLASANPVKFAAFVRFEKQFESLSFCEKLAKGGFLGGQIGLESGSQRVNNIINKGVDVNRAEVALINLRQAGILIHLYTLIGTPGEKVREAKMTGDFIKRRRRELTLGWQIYPLWVLEHGPLAERALEFGLTVKPLPDDILLQISQYEVKQEISQDQATSLAIRQSESLKRFLHPLNDILDIESQKLFLLVQQARGIDPEQVAKICRKAAR